MSENNTESESTEEHEQTEDFEPTAEMSAEMGAEVLADHEESEEPVHIGTFPGTITHHKGDFEVPRCGQLVRAEKGEGVALFVRDLQAIERTVAATGKTVAEHNPEEPPEAPVVGVAFKGQLRDRYDDRWEEMALREPEYLAFAAGNAGVGVYDYPATALEWGAEAGVWRCEGCETLIGELRLSGDQREDGGPCPECEEMALIRLPDEGVSE